MLAGTSIIVEEIAKVIDVVRVTGWCDVTRNHCVVATGVGFEPPSYPTPVLSVRNQLSPGPKPMEPPVRMGCAAQF